MSTSGGTGFFAEFRKFIARGNVVDLAVAVIIGAAFGRIVTSFVEDIVAPAILNPALQAANVNSLQNLVIPGTAIKYGSFLAAILNFLVIAFSIFLLIRALESVKRRFIREKAAEEAVVPDAVIVSQENLTHAIERLTQVIESK
ncbi:large conductance mechanosensitive channel protein MscL [Phormidium tenue FACHB-886]|nr:large conductance mechanosensitive channel protein MscL [Phormidium tenue FACHB-886]